MRIFVRLKRSESRAPVAYYKCEHCVHFVVVEEWGVRQDRGEAPTHTSWIDPAGFTPDLAAMNHSPKPMPPKACPVCRVAMQATRREAEIVHRCERCSLTITVKPSGADKR